MKKKDYVEIIVKDTGKGIPDSLKTKIFEQGFSTKEGGARGIGLALVKNNVNILGGSIKVDSKVGVGSKFVVIIPYTIKNENIKSCK